MEPTQGFDYGLPPPPHPAAAPGTPPQREEFPPTFAAQILLNYHATLCNSAAPDMAKRPAVLAAVDDALATLKRRCDATGKKSSPAGGEAGK